VRFEDRVDLLVGGDLFAVQHAACRLTDDACREVAVSRNVSPDRVNHRGHHQIKAAHTRGSGHHRPRVGDDFLGDLDERAVGPQLPTVAFGRRHPLNLLHATPGGPRAVREETDAGRQDRVEFPNESSQDPHRIPQQRVVGGVMDVECRAYCYAESNSGRAPDFPSGLKLYQYCRRPHSA